MSPTENPTQSPTQPHHVQTTMDADAELTEGELDAVCEVAVVAMAEAVGVSREAVNAECALAVGVSRESVHAACALAETSVVVSYTVFTSPDVFEDAFPVADREADIDGFGQTLGGDPGVEPIFLRAQLREADNCAAALKQADRDLRAVCVPSCEIAGCGSMLPDSIGCYCDDICGKYGDCCPDYAEACPRESCELQGTWYQGDNDGPMDLDILLDENNDISGVGDDEIGEFALEGHATPNSIHLTKRYDDSGVTLVYAGVSADGLHFSGTWEATGYDEKGTFDLTAPDEFLCTPQAVSLQHRIAGETCCGSGGASGLIVRGKLACARKSCLLSESLYDPPPFFEPCLHSSAPSKIVARNPPRATATATEAASVTVTAASALVRTPECFGFVLRARKEL